eukprot:GHVS01063052.1.p1 GENE.GHVS01063052.1~~GHVS01063052.1.p1  ORF type:complete len:466 (+),score=52.60 GHVS01063052.1:59-1456(+)
MYCGTVHFCYTITFLVHSLRSRPAIPPSPLSTSSVLSLRCTSPAYHVPVLRDEVVQALMTPSAPSLPFRRPAICNSTFDAKAPKASGIYLDCTLGGGGHAAAIASALPLGSRLVCVDRDKEALEYCRGKLPEDVVLVHSNFAHLTAHSLASILHLPSHQPFVDGIVLDLGASSHQLDCASRGFSHSRSGPLDMRMTQPDQQPEQCAGPSAYKVVNFYSKSELARIIWEYGDERRAKQVATEILRYRTGAVYYTHQHMVDAVRAVFKLTGETSTAAIKASLKGRGCDALDGGITEWYGQWGQSSSAQHEEPKAELEHDKQTTNPTDLSTVSSPRSPSIPGSEAVVRPITTTAILRAVIARAVYPPTPRLLRDVITRVFQALRIHVNHEIDNLSDFLYKVAPSVLRLGGRLCVLSYHSTEDRLVKRAFNDKSGIYTPLFNRPLKPSEEEVSRNTRSRSACLRVGIRR